MSRASSEGPRWDSGNSSLQSLRIAQRGLSEVEKAERQVKSILNKLTRERFDTLYAQLLGCCEQSEARGEIVQVIAREVFAKATLQHTFVEMYADVCTKLHADLQAKSVEVNFKRVLLNQCQHSFTKYLEPPRIDEGLDYEERYEAHVKYKTRMLGNVRLIAHLMRQRMLSPKIIFHCTDELLTIGTPEALETLCTFLETLGSAFDTKEWQGQAKLGEVFARVEMLSLDAAQQPRTRCLLKDLLDKRKRNWREGPPGVGAKASQQGSPETAAREGREARDAGRPFGLRSYSGPGGTPPTAEARLVRRSTVPSSMASGCRTPNGFGRTHSNGGGGNGGWGPRDSERAAAAPGGRRPETTCAS